ncbi:hypothetical protein K492DRAFT_207896 [Lichtheimia hyalospora FSU 10163]|nr:hypothetical protein K492DRAFT_207896 [Lichtheimia hyalospora FSU 10163]
MSASVAPSTPVPVPTTAPPHNNNNNNSEWLLPMPINDTADSFARDLIDQFDKRHSQLREELVQVSQHDKQHRNHSSVVTDDSTHRSSRQSSIGSIGSSNTSHHNNNPSAAHCRGNSNGKGKTLIVPPHQQHPLEQHQSRSLTTAKMPIRTRSAGDLLRQSSAYLRAKFKAVLADHESDDDDDDDDDDPTDEPDIIHWPIPPSSAHSPNPYPPSKIAINTTISIPRRPPVHYAMIQPPVITQYPPKPLKYSPVEPLDEGLPDPTTASSNTREHEQAMDNIEHVTEDKHRTRSIRRKAIWSRGLENNNDHPPPLQQQRNALLHRISLPVLTRPTFHQERLSHNNPVGKRKKWFFCRPWKRSRKGKERA